MTRLLSRASQLLLLGVVVFVAGRQVGRLLHRPKVESTVGSEKRSSTINLPLHELPRMAADLGMQLVAGVEPNSAMFVHPQSRSWLEVPKPRQQSLISNSVAPSQGFVGPEACVECHRQQYDKFIHTAHYSASAVPSSKNMLGSYLPGSNRMTTASPDLAFEMEEDEHGKFFQGVHFHGMTKRIGIDLVTGSGNIGQTYLFWQSNALYQLHVSYSRETNSWINSPGYHDGTAWYSRSVIPKCIECHATYADWIPETENQYVRESFVLGVTCERCHGPGQAHVQFHRDHPSDKRAHQISNPSRLTRDQTNDVCAQCHFGSGERTQGAPFSFRPGDRLADHWRVDPKSEGLEGGVHSSNQLARLRLSACFIKSESLTCVSCHRTHQDDRDDLKLYSEKCIQCHAPEHCGASEKVGQRIKENCIDCHMTFGKDDHLPVHSNGTTEFPLLRDHYIRILPDAAMRFMNK